MAIIKRKKGSRYQYRYDVSYIDILGTRKRKSSRWFDTKAECEKAQAVFVASTKTPSSNVSFGECCLKWCDVSNPNISELGKRDKISVATRYCAPIWDIPISDITLEKVQYILESDSLAPMSTDLKNRVHYILKGTLRYGVQFCGLKKNVMDFIPRFKKTDAERMREMVVLSPAEFSLFESNVPNAEIAGLFHLLYWTGMRLNECLSLRFVDVSGSKIYLKQQYNDRTKKWTTLKTKNSARTINIDSECLAVIKTQQDIYKNVPEYSPEWFIFGGFKKLAHTTISRYKDSAIASAGLRYFRIHDLRHSHVSYLLDAGVDFYRISRRLGHSSISITLDRYGHLLNDEEADIMSAINAGKMRGFVEN